MYIRDVVKLAPALYKSGTALHMIGPPGCGKSDITKVIRDVLSAEYGEEFGYHDVLLPTVDAPDVRGFLMPAKDAEGKAVSIYTRSALLPTKEYLAAHPRGIYVIDERNSADLLTQKAVAPVVLWKRFGDTYLGDGWWVISASNRMEDRAGVIRAPTHLINRERQVSIESDITSWSIWAEERGLHPMCIAFAKQFPSKVFSPTVPKGDGPFSTARSFTSAATLLGQVAGVDANGDVNMEIPTNDLICQSVAGDIGEGVTAELFAYLKLHDQLPTIQEILADPAAAKVPVNMSAVYAAVQMVLHFAKAQNIEKLWAYTERLPREMQVSAARQMIDKSAGVLLNSKSLTDWLMKNRALIEVSRKAA